MNEMPPCPYAPKKAKGAHCLSVIIPETSDDPFVLFCDRCGMTSRHAIALPVPMDDLTAEDIKRLSVRRR